MAIKIDVSGIISAHFKSLAEGANRSGWDFVVFLFLPAAIAWLLVWLGAYMSDSLLSTIVSGLSIFVGLLLNVVVLLFDIVRNTKKQTVKHKIITETLANVSFTILLSLFTIPFALSTQITRWPFLKPYTSFVTYFLACVFVATLLMVVKRVYALFQDEAANANEAQSEPDKDEWVPLIPNASVPISMPEVPIGIPEQPKRSQ
jgi:Ca2+/H+ antiporter